MNTTATDPAATQEQTGLKQGCLCIQRANDALRDTYPGVKVLVGVVSARPVIATYRQSGKGRLPVLFASFCPFCGIKYGG